MKQIYQEVLSRGVTRLCHFTQSRNLAHILGDCSGIISRKTLEEQGMPHNPSDPNRFDGRNDLICCSIEYPNAYYFAKARQQDRLFRDWVILYIEPSYLWSEGTYFCPCNAAVNCGSYIKKGFASFQLLYAQTTPMLTFYNRSSKHLPALPTNLQAEVLIPNSISLSSIKAIAVRGKIQAQKEILRLKLQGISFKLPIYIVPDFFDGPKLFQSIKSGVKIKEVLYV